MKNILKKYLFSFLMFSFVHNLDNFYSLNYISANFEFSEPCNWIYVSTYDPSIFIRVFEKNMSMN
jgi:hypothetical protein